MGRVLCLFAAIPLVTAGYFARDKELFEKAGLYADAFLSGSGATDVVGPPPSGDAVASASLPAKAKTLFRRPGKEPRADTLGGTMRPHMPDQPGHLMLAALTPQPGASGLPADAPVITASINRAGKEGRLDRAGERPRPNRADKGPRLDRADKAPPHDRVNEGTPLDAPSGSQVLLSQTSPEPPELNGETPDEIEHASVAYFMMAPGSASGFVDSDKAGESEPIAWPGRLHLASLKPKDSETMFGGFTEKEFRARELRCMSDAIYYEARSEPRKGQVAVAQVVMNRVRARAYPDTVCGVIYQGQWNRNACQFSFACDGKPERPDNTAVWAGSKELAREVMDGKQWLPDIGYATHYHANYVRPRWARRFVRVKRIGRHIFYKAPNIRVRVANVATNN